MSRSGAAFAVRSLPVAPVLLALLAGLLVSACASWTGPAPPPEMAVAGLEPSEGAGAVPAGRIRVLLPPGYPDEAPYPTVYFLHDFFGGSGVLWREGVAPELVRRMEAGEMPPVLVVAPEGNKGYWSDFHDGSHLYESWLTGELLDTVERRYRVIPGPRGRAITGISMGGYGAVKAALRHPGLYAEAGSLSGALIPWTWERLQDAPFYLRLPLERVFGDAANDNSLADNNIHRLLREAAAGGAELPRLVLRSGTEDDYDLDDRAATFAALAGELGVPVTLELEPGVHDWDYWRESAVELLVDHARRLHGAPLEENRP